MLKNCREQQTHLISAARYKQENINLWEMTKLMARRPITLGANSIADNSLKYDFRGAKFAGGFAETVQGDQVGTQYNYDFSETLAKVAAEIQDLLKQLEQSAPVGSISEKMALASSAIAQIKANPTLKQRAVVAPSASGIKGFEAAIDHPAAAFIVGTIERWKEAS